MDRLVWAITGLIVVGGLFAASTGGLAVAAQCQAVDGAKVCITDVTVSDSVLVVGERGEITVTLENQGSTTASPLVTMNTVGPNNTTGVYRIGNPTLSPGESTTVTQPLNAETPGTHGVQFIITPANGSQRFDASAVKTIEIRKTPPAELGGPVDQSEIALGVFLVAILGAGVAGYRYFG